MHRSSPALEAALQEALAQAAADPMVPGAMACVLSRKWDLHWHGSAGADGLVQPRALEVDRPFRIASVTKLFVAAAVLRLVEQGRLRLHDPLDRCLTPVTLEQLRAGRHDPSRMTLSQLLTHTSGLPDHVALSSYPEAVMADPSRHWTRADQIAWALDGGNPVGAPGEAAQYSDTGYVILGEIVEGATGRSLGAAVRGLLDFERLGLHRTWWEALEPDRGERARQYMGDIETTAFDPSFDLHGGGGLASTVEDLALFAQALFRGDVLREPGSLATALVVPQARRPPEAFVHSRLAMTIPMGPMLGLGHLGFWGCGAVCCPELDVAIGFAINQARPSAPDVLARLARNLGAALAAAFGGEAMQ